jgi:hypothetical protein
MQIRLKLIDSRKLEFKEPKVDEKTGKPIDIYQHVLITKDNKTGFAIFSTFPLDVSKRMDKYLDYEILPKINATGNLVGWRFANIEEKK